MNSYILNLLSVSALVVCATGYSVTYPSSAYNYHLKVGIPLAETIKKAEEDAARNGSGNQRIINGFLMDISEAPYQVGLINHIGPVDSICGAVLISNTRVVTAAHCKKDGITFPERFTLVFGSNTIFSGGIRQEGTNLIIHPQWNPNTIENDIGVIRTNPIEFTDLIQPVSLPSTSGNNVELYESHTALATGWGQNYNGHFVPQTQSLWGVNMQVISNQECARFYGAYVKSSNICTSGAGNVGICTGDSGGPLVIQDGQQRVLVGITSFGSTNCESGSPGAFARVSSYVPWLLSV